VLTIFLFIQRRRAITQHRSIEDRLEEARLLQEIYPDIPVYVDTLENRLNCAFAAFPERLFVIIDNVIMFEGGTTTLNYSVSKLEKWIISNLPFAPTNVATL